MSQPNMTPEQRKIQQERVLKMLRQATKSVRQKAQAQNPPQKPKQSLNSSPSNLKTIPQTKQLVEVAKNPSNLPSQEDLLNNLNLDQGLDTWTTILDEKNVSVFVNMLQTFNSNIFKSVYKKFVEKPIQINPYRLTQEQLLQKNRAILQTRKGTGLWNDLVGRFYLKYLPQKFQTQYTQFNNFYDQSYTGLFGWWVFATVFVKINAKKQYSRFYQTKHLWLKSSLLLLAGVLGLDTFYRVRLKAFATKNVEIVETTFDSHLKLIQAHGINLDTSFKRFLELEAQ